MITRILLTALLLAMAALRVHAQRTTIELSTRKISIQLDNKSDTVYLDKLPDTLVVVFPDTQPEKYKLLFNDENSTYKKNGKDVKAQFTIGFNNTDSTGVSITTSDIMAGSAELHFRNNMLIGVGKRTIDDPRQIILNKTKPVIFFKNNKPDDKKKEAKDSIWDNLKAPQLIVEVDTTTLKKQRNIKIPGCTDCNEETKMPKDTKCCDNAVESEFSTRFLPPCVKRNCRPIAVSHKYEVVIDERPGALLPVTYLKLKRTKGYNYYKVKKRIDPRTEHDIVYRVIGHADSTYNFENGESQNFMEYENDISEIFSTSKDNDTTGISPTAQVEDPDTSSAATDTMAVSIKINQRTTLVQNQKATLLITLEKFQSLNREISCHNTTECEIQQSLLCISKLLSSELGVSLHGSSDDLEKRLRKAVVFELDKKYLGDFKNLIEQIKSEYEKVNNRKNKYRMYTKQITVPNTDNFDVKIKAKGGHQAFKKEFNTSLGFKIDFSSGLIYSGLHKSDYVLRDYNIRYKERADTISSTGEITPIYTGEIKDSTVKVIHENRKTNINAGFLVHAYTRTGKATNFGLTTGAMINSSDLQLMLGGSVLFSMNKTHRLAISGGLVYGKEKVISRSAGDQVFAYKQGAEVLEGHLFDSIQDIPVYYTGGENLSNYIHEEYNTSFFFAITYNFASLDVK